MNEEFVAIIEETSALHDIGKVGVPDSVLRSPDQLTEEEVTIIRRHPYTGFDTMMEVRRRWGDDQFLVTACQICIAHHERWDGAGYPYGLVGYFGCLRRNRCGIAHQCRDWRRCWRHRLTGQMALI